MTAGVPLTRRWPVAVLVLLGTLQLLLVNFWPLFASPNERARVYQALAVVTRGSLAIDVELARYGGHEDVSSAGGRSYPNKAPGTLPLLLPGAAVARLVGAGDAAAELRWALYLGRLLAASAPTLLAVVLLARRLGAASPRGGPAAVAVFALATPMLAASLLAFSHALTACLLLAGWLLLEGERPSLLQTSAAGLVLAWSVVSEYPTAVPAFVIVALAARRLGWRGSVAVASGALPPLALLALYDAVCFGSPWLLSSALEAHPGYAGLASRGLLGVGWPALSGLATLVLSPDRGLLVWAPVLVVALFGLTARPRRTALAALAPAAALVVVMSGYPNAHGGWFPGPRYLLPILPLLVVPLAAGLERTASHRWSRIAVTAAALWGWLQVWLSVLSFPFPPEGFALPALSFALPLAAEGVAFPSWLPPATTHAAVAGLAVGAAVLLAALLHPVGRRREAGVAAALVAALALVGARVERPDTFTARLQWAVVCDSLRVGDGRALETVRLGATTPGERAAAERWIEARDAARERNR